jgi:SAM-dependent methyltransferase
MKKITHQKMWSKYPNKPNVFVSEFIHHSYPYLNKRKDIKKVLDVACGNGLGVTLPLLRKGYNVTCFDHLNEAVEAVKMNAKDEEFKIDARKNNMYNKFPYKPDSFDAVFCFQAIYHGKLEQIMITLSEIKKTLKKEGLFFGTFLCHEAIKYDEEQKKFYIDVNLPNNKMIKNYHKQDENQPHLFYYLSKDFEYKKPHYYTSKDELKILLKQYFSEVKIKKVSRKKDKNAMFYFVACKK